MEIIVNYYRLCTVAAGGKAHSAAALPEKGRLVAAQIMSEDGMVHEEVVGGRSGVTLSGKKAYIII